MSDEFAGINPPRGGRRLNPDGTRSPSEKSMASPPKSALKKAGSRRERGNHRDLSDASVSFSIGTMESIMTKEARDRAKADLIDENSVRSEKSYEGWFCYRLILAGLLAVFVCVTCFVASCRAFKFRSWDNGDVYYGIRGVTDITTGRCLDWEMQTLIDWNNNWVKYRLPRLYVMGIAGITFVVCIFVAWVAYGVILKAKRDRRKRRVDIRPRKHHCGGPIGPAVIIGVCLIVAGLWMFATIMGNCSNLPPTDYTMGMDLNCNLHTWSNLALTASIALCAMGGSLAFFLKCCCNQCCCTNYLRDQLIDT